MRVVEYVRPDGTSPFGRWFESLDSTAAAKVTTALSRLPTILRLEIGTLVDPAWIRAQREVTDTHGLLADL